MVGTIISREDWKAVQRLVDARHRTPHHNFENLFRGLVFCSDCGSRLCMGTKTRGEKYYHHYRCSTHYLKPKKCPQSHQLSYTVMYQTVLNRIQQLTAAIQNDEEFYALVRSKTEDNLPSDLIEKKAWP